MMRVKLSFKNLSPAAFLPTVVLANVEAKGDFIYPSMRYLKKEATPHFVAFRSGSL